MLYASPTPSGRQALRLVVYPFTDALHIPLAEVNNKNPSGDTFPFKLTKILVNFKSLFCLSEQTVQFSYRALGFVFFIGTGPLEGSREEKYGAVCTAYQLMSPGNNHQFVKTSHAFLRHSSKR
jgi:hypothetical protein